MKAINFESVQQNLLLLKYFCWRVSLFLFASVTILILILLAYSGRGSNPLFLWLTGIGHVKLLLISAVPPFALLVLDIIPQALYTDVLGERPKIFNRLSSKTSLVVLNLLALLILSLIIFRTTQASLFTGVDGDYSVSLFYSQRIWHTSPLSLGSNFLQGLGGNISFPLNTIIDPGYYLGGLSNKLDFILSHSVWSSLLFASTLFLCYSIRLPIYVSLFASWITPILILFPQPFRFDPVASLVPHIATTISASSIILSLILLNSYKTLAYITRLIGISLLFLYILLSSPSNLILVTPLFICFGLFKINYLPNAYQKIRELSLFASIALILSISGSIQYLLGLILNSASVLFKNEFIVDRGSLEFASTLFVGRGIILVPAAILGLLALAFNRYCSLKQSLAGRASLVYTLIILVSGLINWRAPQLWRLPSPIYFEFFLWPLYSIGISYVAYCVFVKISKSISSQAKYKSRIGLLLYLFVLAPTAYLLAFLSVSLFRPSPVKAWKFPPPKSEMMEVIHSSLSYKPGEQFKGRLATFTGLNLGYGISWRDLQGLDYELLTLSHNDMRKAGFWVNSIPTLTEYNSHITPRYYFFATRLLGQNGDKQVRGMMTLRKPNLSVLSAMGITHLLTDSISALLGNPAVKLAAVEQRAELPMYLYKISDVNLSGFSPVQVLKHESVKDLIDSINNPDFDFKSMIAVEESFGDFPMLTPVTNSRVLVESNSYRITASSSGHSILMLPIEYSSCFDVIDHYKSSLPPTIFPGNAVFMSILFKKNLDLSLRYVSTPFQNQNCRLDDYFLFKSNYKSV